MCGSDVGARRPLLMLGLRYYRLMEPSRAALPHQIAEHAPAVLARIAAARGSVVRLLTRAQPDFDLAPTARTPNVRPPVPEPVTTSC